MHNSRNGRTMGVAAAALLAAGLVAAGSNAAAQPRTGQAHSVTGRIASVQLLNEHIQRAVAVERGQGTPSLYCGPRGMVD